MSTLPRNHTIGLAASRKGIFFFCFFTMTTMLILLTACKTVKPYQRAYLNDESMQIGKSSLEKFSANVHTNREGASGGGRAKGSGGCGCN